MPAVKKVNPCDPFDEVSPLTGARSRLGAPAGDKPHRYVFTVWALEMDKLDLNGEASAVAAGASSG